MEFDNEAHNAFISERFRLEVERKSRLEAFDRFVDLAIDGVITMDEAIKGFTEEYITPQASTATTPSA